MARARLGWTLMVSLGLHATWLATALGRSVLSDRAADSQLEPTSEPEGDTEPAATWAGDTFDVDALLGPSPEGALAPALVPEPSPEPPPVEAAPASTPKPAAPKIQTPKPTPPRSDAPTSSTSGTPDGSGRPGAGTYGQAEGPTARASLAKGLLRVLPRAAYPEAEWHDLSMSAQEKIVFSLELDADGRIGAETVIERKPEPSPLLARVLRRSVLLLGAGTFALAPDRLGVGQQKFELIATLATGLAADSELARPEDLAEMGRLTEPTQSEPGRASFRFNSGREVLLTLRLLPAGG